MDRAGEEEEVRRLVLTSEIEGLGFCFVWERILEEERGAGGFGCEGNQRARVRGFSVARGKKPKNP